MDLPNIISFTLDIVVIAVVIGILRYHFSRLKTLSDAIDKTRYELLQVVPRDEIERMISKETDGMQSIILERFKLLEYKIDLVLKLYEQKNKSKDS